MASWGYATQDSENNNEGTQRLQIRKKREKGLAHYFFLLTEKGEMRRERRKKKRKIRQNHECTYRRHSFPSKNRKSISSHNFFICFFLRFFVFIIFCAFIILRFLCIFKNFLKIDITKMTNDRKRREKHSLD